MKKHFKFLSLIFFTSIALSCSKSKENEKTNGVDIDLDDAISQAESRRATNPEAKGGNTCLLNYNLNYDQLLTEEVVLEATGFSKDVLDTKYSKALKNPEYHSVSYRFANKRKGKATGMDFETELRDMVTIKSIKAMSLNNFRNTYRTVTDDQVKVANQTIDDVVDGKIDDKDAKEKLKETEKLGVDKKTLKGVVGELKGTFEKVGKSYSNVEGLGDAATWNTFTKELNVLQNGVQFELNVDISNDNEKNKNLAIAIAKVILGKCK